MKRGGGKVYAVMTADKVKRSIYSNWDEASKHILGFNVKHKSFPSTEAANAWLDQMSGRTENTPLSAGEAPAAAEDDAGDRPAKKQKAEDDLPPGGAENRFGTHPPPTKTLSHARAGDMEEMRIFTDGSHKKGTGQRGAGGILMFRGQELHWAASDKTVRKFVEEASNPTMELFAARTMLERVLDEYDWKRAKPQRIIVNADYDGVMNYGKGKWHPKTKSNLPWFHKEAKALVDVTKRIKAHCPIDFRHVRGHSGVYGNESADSLADCNQDIDELNALNEI